MPQILPFRGREANQDIDTTIGEFDVSVHLRWNGRENEDRGAWFFSLYDVQGNLIAGGLKIVLGAYIGRGIDHPLFRDGVFLAVDRAQRSNRNVAREARFSDLGTRVRVYYYTEQELANQLNFLAYEDRL